MPQIKYFRSSTNYAKHGYQISASHFARRLKNRVLLHMSVPVIHKNSSIVECRKFPVNDLKTYTYKITPDLFSSSYFLFRSSAATQRSSKSKYKKDDRRRKVDSPGSVSYKPGPRSECRFSKLTKKKIQIKLGCIVATNEIIPFRRLCCVAANFFFLLLLFFAALHPRESLDACFVYSI